jgi:hypothetical protein
LNRYHRSVVETLGLSMELNDDILVPVYLLPAKYCSR